MEFQVKNAYYEIDLHCSRLATLEIDTTFEYICRKVKNKSVTVQMCKKLGD